MRGCVTMQHPLSLGDPIPSMIPGVMTTLAFIAKMIILQVNAYHVALIGQVLATHAVVWNDYLYAVFNSSLIYNNNGFMMGRGANLRYCINTKRWIAVASFAWVVWCERFCFLIWVGHLLIHTQNTTCLCSAQAISNHVYSHRILYHAQRESGYRCRLP